MCIKIQTFRNVHCVYGKVLKYRLYACITHLYLLFLSLPKTLVIKKLKINIPQIFDLFLSELVDMFSLHPFQVDTF